MVAAFLFDFIYAAFDAVGRAFRPVVVKIIN